MLWQLQATVHNSRLNNSTLALILDQLCCKQRLMCSQQIAIKIIFPLHCYWSLMKVLNSAIQQCQLKILFRLLVSGFLSKSKNFGSFRHIIPSVLVTIFINSAKQCYVAVLAQSFILISWIWISLQIQELWFFQAYHSICSGFSLYQLC